MARCSYKHCPKPEEDILGEEQAVRNGKVFHKGCLDTSETIKKIVDLYYTKVSNTVVMTVLVRTINNIVFEKGIDSHYLLYALNSAVIRKRQIKSPVYLQYLIDDFDIKKAWEAEQGKRLLKEAQNASVAQNVTAPVFKQSESLTGFNLIFNGR